jgi:WD40 repeat protein
MEFVDGIDLLRLVKDSGPLPVALACEYVRQAALGLQHAHERGLVHRDVKPSNLLLARDAGGSQPGNAGVVKVLDMGLARVSGTGEGTQLTRDGAVVGTPDYLAPEQARNASGADARADVYSLGCTLYFLLAGRPPFQGGSLTELLLQHQMEEAPSLDESRTDLPPQVSTVVQRMMAKKPEHRYQSAAEVAAALEPLGSTAGTLPQPAPVQRAPRRSTPALDKPDTLADTPDESSIDRTEVYSLSRENRGRKKTGRKRSRSPFIYAGVGGGLFLVIVLLTAWFFASSSQPKPMPVAAPQVQAAAVVIEAPRAPKAPKAPDLPAIKAPPPPNVPAAQPAAAPPPLPAPIVVPPAAAAGGAAVVLREVRRVETGGDHISKMAVTPDGRRAIALVGSKLYYLDLETGKVLRQFVDNTINNVHSIALIPNSRRVLLGRWTDGLCELDLDTGQFSRGYPPVPSAIYDLAVSADGRYAYAACGRTDNVDGKFKSSDCRVRVYDLMTRQEHLRTAEYPYLIMRLALSPDGRRLLFNQGGQFYLWDIKAGTMPKPLEKYQGQTQRTFRWANDNRQVLATNSDRFVYLWDVDRNQEVLQFQPASEPTSVAVSPDQRRILIGFGPVEFKDQKAIRSKPTVQLWDLYPPRQLARFEGHTGAVVAVAFSPDGRTGFSAGGYPDATVRVWDLSQIPAAGQLAAQAAPVPPVAPPPPMRVVSGQPRVVNAGSAVNGLVLSTDGKWIVTAQEDGHVHIYDFAEGNEIRRLPKQPGPASAVAISPDGQQVISAARGDEWVFVSNATTGEGIKRIRIHNATALAFTPDGKRFLASSEDAAINQYEAGTCRFLGALRGHEQAVDAIAVAPDSRTALSGCRDGSVRVWDLEKGITLRTVLQKSTLHPIAAVAVSPDGNHYLTAGKSAIYRFPASSNTIVSSISGNVGGFRAIAFTPDGSGYVSTDGSGRVTANSFVPLRDLLAGATKHAGAARGVAVTPDGKYAVSGGEDGKILITPIPTPQ